MALVFNWFRYYVRLKAALLLLRLLCTRIPVSASIFRACQSWLSFFWASARRAHRSVKDSSSVTAQEGDRRNDAEVAGPSKPSNFVGFAWSYMVIPDKLRVIVPLLFVQTRKHMQELNVWLKGFQTTNEYKRNCQRVNPCKCFASTYKLQ